MTILKEPLQYAMRLIKDDRVLEAVAFLHLYLHTHPEDDQAWYLLAYCTPSQQERIEYLSQCLRANPMNNLAAEKLASYQPPKPPIVHPGNKTNLEQASIPVATMTPQEPQSLSIEEQELLTGKKHISFTGLLKFLNYSLKKGFSIFLTIIIGVFLTILVVNQTGQIDTSIRAVINNEVNQLIYQGYFDGYTVEERFAIKEALIEEKAGEIGLNLPYLPRHILWTYRFMTLQWGEAQFPQRISPHLIRLETGSIRDIVLTALPNTLLLIGAAYLLLFLLGIPLALTLSRHNGSLIDRFFSFLSPISSIPSWVIGILLMLIIALELRLLPFGGMYDSQPPVTQWGYIEVIARHMVLPVLSIFISLFFQLVYTWRTYFQLFSEEDYVELAVAKGLPNRVLQRKYILRPGTPYVLTSFSLTFVSFWQTTTALEVIFNWPGIGYTYIKSLPHFFGEAMFPGDLLVAIAIVVIFAYLLGLVVYLLDLAYALVDPRIRIGDQENIRIKIRKLRVRRKARHARMARESLSGIIPFHRQKKPAFKLGGIRKKIFTKIWIFWKELIRYPSAVIGLSIILLFIIGSFYAVFAYPYKEAGMEWNSSVLTGQVRGPRLGKPTWVNLFRKNKYPTSLSLNTALGQGEKQIIRNQDGNDELTIVYTFEFPYGEIPQDILVYYEPSYDVKKPFAVVTWITPNGEEYSFNGTATGGQPFNLADNVSMRRFLRSNPEWQQWVYTDAPTPVSPLWALFAMPNFDQPVVQQGTYQVRIDALLFEENNDLDVNLVIIGQVFGMAGTDYMRRDLMFPLLWGLPYVIFFGLFGAFITTVLALVVSAVGVWFGGWVDNLIQRITEANMIIPVLAIAILVHVIYGVNLTIIIAAVILMNVFSTPTKTFRSAFLQIKDSLYIEAAQVYGASNSRLIFTYMIPRILPVIIPQLVILIPGFIFLEATFGLFNITSMYPTWGRIIYEALREGASYGSRYWVLEPLFMLLLTAFAFTLLGAALDRVLNPKLQKD